MYREGRLRLPLRGTERPAFGPNRSEGCFRRDYHPWGSAWESLASGCRQLKRGRSPECPTNHLGGKVMFTTPPRRSETASTQHGAASANVPHNLQAWGGMAW